MRKTGISVALSLFVFASFLSLHAATLDGVTMPDTVQVGGANLMLNGLGLRTKYMVKVNVAGLYLEQKSSDPGTIIKSDAPKRIDMKFLHGASKSQMTDAFDQSFSDNTPDAKKTMKPEIEKLLAALEPVKSGDVMVFTYTPAAGSSLTINGKEKVTIPGSPFAQVLFSVWFGPKPPNADLKTGMLGK